MKQLRSLTALISLISLNSLIARRADCNEIEALSCNFYADHPKFCEYSAKDEDWEFDASFELEDRLDGPLATERGPS